ncbi:MAG: hypothetical protein ABEI27_03725 [Halobellus sp.]|uniref:hypothetical protein n=1 Tax=Halobellus sp. TaxID=1979212 RepID=UPI0035D49036
MAHLHEITMNSQTLYPVLLGTFDLGLAGILGMVAPVLGVMMAFVGSLVVVTFAFQHLSVPSRLSSLPTTSDA